MARLRLSRRALLLLVAVTAAVIVVATVAVRDSSAPAVAVLDLAGPRVRELDLPAGPTRMLVIAPHPDDEAIGVAGLIQRIVATGGDVHVVVLTSGDAMPEGVAVSAHKRDPTPEDYRTYAKIRERETIAGMERLGVSADRVTFLGFPDGGLCLVASAYLSSRARPFTSPYTERREPPAAHQIIRGVAYRGTDLRRELDSVVTRVKPTLMLIPSVEDDHPDHCAAAIFSLEAAADATKGGAPIRQMQYLVHHEGWPDLEADAATPLRPPGNFPDNGGSWRSLALTAKEAEGKQRALVDAYRSQMLVIGRFLHAFARPNELFLEGPFGSQPECWCDERNVATELPPDRQRRRPRRR